MRGLSAMPHPTDLDLTFHRLEINFIFKKKILIITTLILLELLSIERKGIQGPLSPGMK